MDNRLRMKPQCRSRPAMRVALVVFGLLVVCGPSALSRRQATPSMSDGWKRVEPGYRLVFPRDHASHPEYRIEWWYYTGNLSSENGRRFGYQVTFFRVGMDPIPANPSRWAVRDLYMAHLAVTDVDGARHLTAERLNRAGIGWAGASVDTLNVWNDDWRVRLDGDAHLLQAADRNHQIEVSLRLEPVRAPVAHGEKGFSQKGAEPGNASYYYSITRLATRGTLTLDGRAVAVDGLSWMDHEFSTSFLEAPQVGWDWFAIQLEDGSDLMLYRLRLSNGDSDERSGGTLVEATGREAPLREGDFRLEGGRQWRSPSSGAAYPVEWTVRVPDEDLTVSVRAVVDAQELQTEESTGVTYWEGAVTVTGTRRGRAVSGRGYLEMTGYAGEPMSEVLR